MKKILIAYYTQSGQIKEIIDQYISVFDNDENYQIYYHRIMPVNDFSYPWSDDSFYDVFPESVLEKGCELNPMPQELIQDYDMIILGLQVWYLSPSIPITAFLQSHDFKTIASNTSVVTINGCRNMWFMSQQSVKNYLSAVGAIYQGHIVLFDKVNNLLSVISIIHWAYTGKKEKKWGIIPMPGISKEDIQSAKQYGSLLKEYWQSNRLDQLQQAYIENNGVIVLPHLMSMEHKAKRIFKIWTHFILKGEKISPKQRRFRLQLFKYYLLFMIYLLSPIATLIFYITYPLFYKRIRKNIDFYQGLSSKD